MAKLKETKEFMSLKVKETENELVGTEQTISGKHCLCETFHLFNSSIYPTLDSDKIGEHYSCSGLMHMVKSRKSVDTTCLECA